MTAERWEQVQNVFVEALARPSAERAAFVESACSGDAALQRDVLALLDEADRLGPVDDLAHDVIAPITAHWRRDAPLDRRVGPYRIVRELGRGGMGAVYLASRDDGQFEQQVALKVMRDRVAGSGTVDRFLHERQILAQLAHPNIAHLLDGGVTSDGVPYFVMEYVDGTPIDAYCADHALAVDARVRLVLAVGAAVQHAHQRLIVHRDLKPSNVLVTGTPESGDGPQVKLLDFGIAKLLDAASAGGPRTRTGLHLMTPEYASPEQVRGEAVTTATDVYALGMLLYELLTGRRPYELRGRTPSEIEHIICEADPVRPSMRVRTATETGATGLDAPRWEQRLRGDLDTIVLKALQKDPERRYASVEALCDDLRRHLDGRPVRARPDTLGYRVTTFVRRNRTSVVAALLVIVSLVGGLAAALWQARAASDEREVARLEAAKAEQVTAFLVDLFETADPAEARGDTLNAYEIVDAGATRIEEELAEQPELQAEVMEALGRVYQNMGDYDRARSLLESAQRLRFETLGPAHPDRAESLNNLGVLLVYKGQFDDAASHFRRALRVRRAVFDPPHEDIASTLNNLGSTFHHQGRLDSAEFYYREALAMRQRLVDDGDPALAINLSNVAMVRKYKGDYETADSLLQAALAIQRAALGADHPDVANTLGNLGTVLVAKGDHTAAETVLREGLAIQRAVLGNDHPQVSRSINNLAAVLERQGDLDGAEHLYRESLDLKRTVFGNEHPSVAATTNNLGLLLLAQGNREAAEPLLQESLQLRRAIYGDDHPDVARALSNLAALYTDAGEHAAALPLHRDALRIRQRVLPAGHEQIADVQLDLGSCLLALGRHEDAEPFLRDSYRTLKAARGLRDAETQQALERLVTLYETMGQNEQAVPLRALRAGASE